MTKARLDSSFSGEGEDRRVVCCIYCEKPQPVSRRAMTVNCKFCNKILRLEPLVIDEYQARRTIETCDSVTIDKNGNFFGDRILCGALVVRGKIRADIVSRGPVLVGPTAQIRGNIRAPSMAGGVGASLAGDCEIGPAAGQADRPEG